jgi:hypothetical protein
MMLATMMMPMMLETTMVNDDDVDIASDGVGDEVGDDDSI